MRNRVNEVQLQIKIKNARATGSYNALVTNLKEFYLPQLRVLCASLELCGMDEQLTKLECASRLATWISIERTWRVAYAEHVRIN